MAAWKIVRAFLLATVKLVICAAVVFLACTVALRIQRAGSPTSKDVCGRVQLGMTVEQVEDTTRAFEGWQLLRYDGVMVISTGPHRDSPVCRVAIDPKTHRATSKSMGPLQQGDWPTL